MSRRIEKPLLILAMCLGGLLIWTAVPAVWLWIAGRYARVSQSDMSSLALVYAGTPTSMFAVGRGLGRLERRYAERFNPGAGRRVVGAAWLQSLRGGKEDEPATILDKILIVNVALAVIVITVWFALFSHGSQAPHI